MWEIHDTALYVEGWALDTEDLVGMLHEEIHLSKGSAQKHIIRFNRKEDYTACLARMQSASREAPGSTAFIDLKIINAISCTLRRGNSLLKAPQIKSIEADICIKLHDAETSGTKGTIGTSPRPNKPYNGSQLIPWGVSQIKAPLAWKRSLGNRVRIGVVDTGVDPTHPDLKLSVYRGINLLNPNLLPNDDNGHGTHIAGIIAASSNRQGILGVAPQASIHAVKAFDKQGSAYVSDIIAGIDWCVDNDMDIINMSFGMNTYSQALEVAIKNAYKSGKIIVASCGNEGKRSSIDYPARFTQVVSVGALTRSGKVASFSNKGKRIDIYAPGEKIYSCWLGGNYHELSGTSMATAHVTGTVALMLGIRPSLKPQQIKQTLKRHSIALSKDRRDSSPGYLNARRAVVAISRN